MKHLLLTLVIALTANTFSNAQTLQIDPIYIGGTAYFEVHNATPDAIAIVCYSTTGTGPFTLANGLTFDLSMPIRQLQPMVVDSLGDRQLGPFPVPSNAVVGMQLLFQDGAKRAAESKSVYGFSNHIRQNPCASHAVYCNSLRPKRFAYAATDYT